MVILIVEKDYFQPHPQVWLFLWKVLANSTKMCYTYDSLSRVKTRTIKNATTNAVISTETFDYDAAGNVTDAPDSCFGYDTQNRLIIFNNNEVSYDLDGNMLSNGSSLSCSYDSSNKLITAGGHTYTYNGESVRIRNLCTDEDTTYTYDNNAKLNRLLCKTTNGVTTKYVYGRGLIGEETNGSFKTYHFDARGSTIAITDASGNITDTFAYDTYGKLISRTGTSAVIFGYNGRDGVVTDKNGLIYMRARYYSPEMKRFINADIIAGSIDNAVTLNRFAYANGNPVSMIDPFGLMSEEVYRKKMEQDEAKFEAAASKTFNTTIKYDTPEKKETVWDKMVNYGERVININQQQQEFDGKIRQEQIEIVNETISDVEEWLDDTKSWMDRNMLNDDGSYAIYDNQRFRDSVFHEQIIAFTPSGPSFDLRNGNIGLGSFEVDAITGGWEGEQANLSLLDFGHAEVGAEIKDGQVKLGALASIWSPSFSFSIGDLSVDIGAEVGAVGAGFKKVNHGVSLFGAFGFGGSLTFSWND